MISSPRIVGFEDWKAIFRNDCLREGNMQAFYCFSDRSLKMLWEFGVEPSVKAVSVLIP